MSTVHSNPQLAAPSTNEPSGTPNTHEVMTPFVRVPQNVVAAMLNRQKMLSQPREVFERAFGGRVPTMAEVFQAVEGAIQRSAFMTCYENNLYHVKVAASRPFIHLNVHRRDGTPCKQWRHFQQIKNELVGPEFEAVELYPAESRLVDTGHEYHLWVYAESSFRFPFGFSERWVLENPVEPQFPATPTAVAPPVMPMDCIARPHTESLASSSPLNPS